MIEVKEGKLGKKVLAVRDVSANSPVTRFNGRRVNFEETKKLNNESFALQTDTDEYLYLDPPYCYFNHSCEPNCGLTPDLMLITLRDVEKNEELTYDYSTTMFERSWTMDCHCGKKTCRHVIGDFDSLARPLRNYYIEKNVVQRFILEQMKNG